MKRKFGFKFTTLLASTITVYFFAGCLHIDSDLVVGDALTTHRAQADAPRAKRSLATAGNSPDAPVPFGALLDYAPSQDGVTIQSMGSTKVEQASGVPAIATAVYGGLELLNRQVGNSTNSKTKGHRVTGMQRILRQGAQKKIVQVEYVDQETGPLDKSLTRDTAIRKFLAASQTVLYRKDERKGTISPFEVASLATHLSHSVTKLYNEPDKQQSLHNVLASMKSSRNIASESRSGGVVTIKVSLDAISFAYLQAYVEGTFISRDGTKISKPDIGEKIGNDTITGFERVVLEAIFDYATMTPVLHKKDKAEIDDATPTFAKLFPDLYEQLSDTPSEDGITETEYGLVTLLTNLGSEQSKHLSAIIMRGFGGAHIDFILGGKFSFGDNDSLSKVVSTFCEVFVADTVGTLNYDFFENFHYSVDNGTYRCSDNDNAHNLAVLGITKEEGQVLCYALQNEEFLAGLLKGNKK